MVINVIEHELDRSKTYLVQGSWATINEYNVSIALDHYKIPYKFQQYVGTVGAAGYFRVDFVVFVPFSKPLEIFGNYWHSGIHSAKDKWKLQMLQSMYGNEAIVIWGDECDTIEKAKSVVKKRVR